MTTSLPRLVALSIAPRGARPWRPFLRAVDRVDGLLRAAIRRGGGGDAVLDELIAAGASEDELRDQVVTLLAAGHETTAGSLAWACERLARHPAVVARLRDGDDAYLDATVKEVLRVRPVLSITPRKVVGTFDVGGHALPPGVHVTPCLYLAHRRPELWPDPTAFRPERFLDGAPAPYSWLPFGGGTRRCAGAAFATMELHEVLRAVVARFDLRPDRPEGERMVRRGVTLAPSRGGRVVPLAFSSTP
jgi:cytochrome P450